MKISKKQQICINKTIKAINTRYFSENEGDILHKNAHILIGIISSIYLEEYTMDAISIKYTLYNLLEKKIKNFNDFYLYYITDPVKAIYLVTKLYDEFIETNKLTIYKLLPLTLYKKLPLSCYTTLLEDIILNFKVSFSYKRTLIDFYKFSKKIQQQLATLGIELLTDAINHSMYSTLVSFALENNTNISEILTKVSYTYYSEKNNVYLFVAINLGDDSKYKFLENIYEFKNGKFEFMQTSNHMGCYRSHFKNYTFNSTYLDI